MITLTDEQALQIEDALANTAEFSAAEQFAREQKAIATIRAARAQEQAEQEPVARVAGYYGGRCVVEPINGAMVLPKDMALYAEPVEPVKKDPVRFVWNGEGWIEADDYIWKTTDDHERRELYAEPVKHKLADVIAPTSGYDIDADPLYQQGYSDALKEHWSDCSVHNEPAYPNGKCDCGGYTEAEQKPVAYLSDLSDPQPHAVTDLKYCSWAQHERGDHLKYVPVYAAPVQQVTRADLKAAFKEGFERAADLYAPNDGQEPYAYEVWDVQDQSFTMIYATQLKEFHWIEPENIARVLYAAPVRTKDLTDDEIHDVFKSLGFSLADPRPEDFSVARAVIAADRRKNK